MLAHLSGKDKDEIVAGKRLLERVGNWKSYLIKAQGYGIEKELERHERTDRPLGDDRFIELAEKLLSRDLKKKKRGRRCRINEYCVPIIRLPATNSRVTSGAQAARGLNVWLTCT